MKSRTVSADGRKRRGAVAVLMAALAVVLFAMVAFGVDVGYMCLVKTELQRTSDAGALAGAGTLVEGTDVAEAQVRDFIDRNLVAGHTLAQQDVDIYTGTWDADTKTFTEGGTSPSAIRVVATNPNEALFFGRVLDVYDFTTRAESIAVYQPRDIVVVLDYSGSMNDDSELKSKDKPGLSQALIEDNLLQIYGELGSPTFGSMQFTPQYISSNYTSTIKSTLGLTYVSYPYPSGSWNDYISYVKNSNNISNAGYHKKYGYLTFMNYLLEQRESHSETPLLAQVSAQPVTAVKNAVSVFLAYLQEVDTDDRVGLVAYTSSNGTYSLESELTANFNYVETRSRDMQAGHYQPYTNIGDGIRGGREEMANHGRPGAFKLIVLMTDGIANRPSGVDPTQYARDQAELTGNAGIPIVAISLGSGADQDLMQDIADLTGGVHVNIPGGQTVAAYEEHLKDIFRQVADDRPLKLIK